MQFYSQILNEEMWSRLRVITDKHYQVWYSNISYVLHKILTQNYKNSELRDCCDQTFPNEESLLIKLSNLYCYEYSL